MRPFTIQVSDSELDNLRRRLSETRFPQATPGAPWSRGFPPDELRALVQYWLETYDWRSVETRLNRLPQYIAEVEGCAIHFVWVQGRHKDRLPVVLSHGWPYTFAEMLPTLEAINGEVDVVVPSLPGFAFSGVLPVEFAPEAIADRWHALMTEVLGYKRYLTYGEDAGAPVSDWLAGKYPKSVAGIVASHASFGGRDRPGVILTDEEQAFFDNFNQPQESGYAHQQGTRPDTLAAAVSDSPAGLLAWIAEKYAAWTPGIGLEGFHSDEVITPAMLFWITNSIGTSFRHYTEGKEQGPHPIVEVPASLIIQQQEATYPRSLGEKSYQDIRSFQVLDQGGHFPAWKAPGEVARAILELEANVR